MRDYKPSRSGSATATRYTRTKVKPNRKRQEPRPPRDWKGLLQRLAVTGKWLALGGSLAGAGLLIVATGKFMVYDSPFFRVDTIQVETAGRIDAEQICEMSDIRRGTGMFSLDLERIGEKIAENPWISSARVERVFPRTVTIKVSEYTPAAIVNLECLYYVAEDGTVFKPLEIGDKVDFPLLTGISRQDILDHPEETRRLLGGAVQLLHLLATRSTFHLGKVSEIRIDETEGYEMMTINGGVPIKIGFDNYESKLTRLERIYSELEPRLPVLNYIDLNAVDRVIVKLDPSLTETKKEKKG